jgi:hypothetical protein
VNGQAVAFDAYTISGNNYFKLRDLAYVLHGTEKQFAVTWDGAGDAISLASGQPYTPVGGEMAAKGSGAKTPAATNSQITRDGSDVSFTAYNIDGNNYVKLRDVGQTFDFGVDWDGAQNTIRIDTTAAYTPEPAAIFADIPNMPISFTLTSGAGGSETTLSLNADGTFSGNYCDLWPGEAGEGYSSMLAECKFDGKFTEVRKINEYEYVMKVDFLNIADTGKRIEDDLLIIPVESPWGIYGADEFRFYLPGRPTADLPEDYIYWVTMASGWHNTSATLPFYGLYNTGSNDREGFFSSYEPNE